MPAPTNHPDWATVGTNNVVPPGPKIADGWLPAERPPAGWFNWWQNLVGLWVRWLETRANTTDSNLGTTNTNVTNLTNSHNTLSANAALKNAANSFSQPQTIPNLQGNTNVAGNLITTGEIDVGTDLFTQNVFAYQQVKATYAAGGFTYRTTPTIVKSIDPLACTHDTLSGLGLNGRHFAMQPNARCYYPLHFPHGATLGQVRILVQAQGGAASIEPRLCRRYNINHPGQTLPDYKDDIGIVNTTTVNDGQILDIGLGLTFGNLTVNYTEGYGIAIHSVSSTGGYLNILAIDISYTDPGPRNH